MGEIKMTYKVTSSNVGVIKVDSKDIEILGTKGSFNSVGKKLQLPLQLKQVEHLYQLH